MGSSTSLEVAKKNIVNMRNVMTTSLEIRNFTGDVQNFLNKKTAACLASSETVHNMLACNADHVKHTKDITKHRRDYQDQVEKRLQSDLEVRRKMANLAIAFNNVNRRVVRDQKNKDLRNNKDNMNRNRQLDEIQVRQKLDKLIAEKKVVEGVGNLRLTRSKTWLDLIGSPVSHYTDGAVKYAKEQMKYVISIVSFLSVIMAWCLNGGPLMAVQIAKMILLRTGKLGGPLTLRVLKASAESLQWAIQRVIRAPEKKGPNVVVNQVLKAANVVRNPLTGRMVKKGGPTHRRLVEQGMVPA